VSSVITSPSNTVVVPTPPAPETPEQRRLRLLSKVQQLRDNQMRAGEVIGDPNKVYRWVNHRDERQLFFQVLGYELCKDTKLKCPVKQQADGTWHRGDLILYQIDKELQEELDAVRELKSIEALEGSEMSFQQAAARENVPTFRPKLK
jgi:hypothetical protein